MMVAWLVAIPLRSTKCILNHSRAQERGRLLLVESDHQEPTGPRVCLTGWLILTKPGLQVSFDLLLPQGWLVFDLRTDLLWDTCWMLPMIWEHSRVDPGLASVNAVQWDQGWVQGDRALGLAGESVPPTAPILGKGLLYSHLWVMLQITLRSKDSLGSLNSCGAKHDYFKSFHFPQGYLVWLPFAQFLYSIQLTDSWMINPDHMWLSFLSNTGKSVSLLSWETGLWGDNKKLGVGKKSGHPNRILRSSCPV